MAMSTAYAIAADSMVTRNRGIGLYPGNPTEYYPSIERRGTEGNRYYLDGNQWRMNGLQHTHPEGEAISNANFDDSKWMQATVPSTNFMNYVNSGRCADPNYGDNILDVDHAPFADDFWYRTTFRLPDNFAGKTDHIWLNFDGVNWKAHIFLNGKRIGRIAGAFKHGRFDVTPYLSAGENVLAVKVISNHHQGRIHNRTIKSTGPNGGVLGADNPTFHASVGWDWIPTIPGRNDGIWNNVYLSAEGPVSLSAPMVDTRLNLPDTIATLTPAVTLTNPTKDTVNGILTFSMGDISLSQPVKAAPGTTFTAEFHPEQFQALNGVRLPLWWPNGMGEPTLHPATFIFSPTDTSMRADTLAFNAGLRQIDMVDPDTNLKVYVNGRRMAPLGGNWGFPEANLRYGKREYDTALDFHRRMHFTTIRNWVGQTGDEEFYDACDRNGVMIWQDFWLANPGDGPNPDDESMFMENARDMVSRIRRHPSILLYCGRNEGNPPATLDHALRQCVDSLHPGMLYIPHSASNGVSGFGPYNARRRHEYFENQSGKTHSERGMPAPMNYENLRRTLPDSMFTTIFGRGLTFHDFTRHSAQGGDTFLDIMQSNFGKIDDDDIRRFTQLAQCINYDGYRAMFEATSRHRQGLLLWMSHPAWPSMVWQTYDYYFEPTAAFFGSRKGCEPLHIQHNPITDCTEIVNRTGMPHKKFTATTRLLDIYGKQIDMSKTKIDIATDTTLQIPTPSLPAGYNGVYFLDQSLTDSKGKILSENFYVLSTEPYNYQALNTIGNATVKMSCSKPRSKGTSQAMTVTLRNTSKTPAMLLRLNLLDADGDQILPANYSDNYIHLMPGRTATVTVEWDMADTRSDSLPHIDITGFNLAD